MSLKGRVFPQIQIDAETGVGDLNYTGSIWNFPFADGTYLADGSQPVDSGHTLGGSANPAVSLSWSDDGGHTWSSDYPAALGAIGKYKTRLIWRRIGYSRDRVFRFTCSEAVKKVFIDGHENGLTNRIIEKFQLDAETGVGDITGLNPQINLSWSDDGGHTWSSEYTSFMGQIGKYKTRLIWRRLGYSRDRIYRITCADAVKKVFIDAYEEAVKTNA